MCIVYDPTRSSQGVLALKALRLTDAFMNVYRTTDFTAAQILEKGLDWSSVFLEIPLTVTNSALCSALLGDVMGTPSATQADYDTLSLSAAPFLEKNLEFLIDCMDDLQGESLKVQLFHRMLSRQQQSQAAWLQKRRAENAARRASGQEPLPEEDASSPAFRPVQEPARLDSYLIVNQVIPIFFVSFSTLPPPLHGHPSPVTALLRGRQPLSLFLVARSNPTQPRPA